VKVKITVDLALCDGNGNCCQAAPDYFELTESDVVDVLRAEVRREDLENVERAVTVCPKGAISLSE
jgi:ferredoxin